jgi:glutamyl-tRNA synthetase
MKPVRVRFAPSPTGGLHLGGVRTVLFNYLFAKKQGGTFVLRIEDTDQTRFVEGAEQYIIDCLQWCGLQPDESVINGGNFGPYRQSERKPLYKKYAEQLVEAGHAYYAFDTAQELDAQRSVQPNFQYGHSTRQQLKNSLTLSAIEVAHLLEAGTPYVVRIKMPVGETICFTDLIRGEVSFEANLLDDKVLLKADGMPTYHLAVVVDDYLMQITHAFRGEEWLPSAPVHILLWQWLFGLDAMPQWAHLPLILKPDGNGKLSKRDGDRLGFPVFAMDWTDPRTNEKTTGFKEIGFLPEAFINMLAMLGWSSGTEQEIFSIEELINQFSIERVNKGGAKFDFEKAKWYNQEWIKRSSTERLLPNVLSTLQEAGISNPDSTLLQQAIPLVKERCMLLKDFVQQVGYFFKTPNTFDIDAIQPKWNTEKHQFFVQLQQSWHQETNWSAELLETSFKAFAAHAQLKPGDLMLPFRIMLVGGKFGPAVFDIAALLGKSETLKRMNLVLELLIA